MDANINKGYGALFYDEVSMDMYQHTLISANQLFFNKWQFIVGEFDKRNEQNVPTPISYLSRYVAQHVSCSDTVNQWGWRI